MSQWNTERLNNLSKTPNASYDAKSNIQISVSTIYKKNFHIS